MPDSRSPLCVSALAQAIERAICEVQGREALTWARYIENQAWPRPIDWHLIAQEARAEGLKVRCG
jgi:hypothetical protein